MPLPLLREDGDLPEGVHAASLEDALSRFGQSTVQRMLVGARLERIYKLVAATGHLKRFVIFGSFVTSKPDPNDIDVFLVMHDSFELGQVTGEAQLVFNHAVAQSHFGASVFWLRRGIVEVTEEP